MNIRKLLLLTLASIAPISLSSCGSSSGRLKIVHFDQAILGETSKDLGVSIGMKQNSDDLKSSINNVLSSLNQNTRNEWMTLSVDRANEENVTKGNGLSLDNSDENKTLYVGLECDYAPFNWTETSQTDYTYPINGINGQYAAGSDVLVAHYIASSLGYDLKIQKMDWDALIPWVQQGENRIIIAGMTDTEERRLSIDFSDEYWKSELVLVVKEDSKYANATSLDDFKGAKIVSQTSTVTDDVITTWETSYNVNHLSPLDTFSTCALAVINGTADAMTAELPVATSIVNGTNR